MNASANVATMSDAEMIEAASAAIATANPSHRTLAATVEQIAYRRSLVKRLAGAGKAGAVAKQTTLHARRAAYGAVIGANAYWVPEYELAANPALGAVEASAGMALSGGPIIPLVAVAAGRK